MLIEGFERSNKLNNFGSPPSHLNVATPIKERLMSEQDLTMLIDRVKLGILQRIDQRSQMRSYNQDSSGTAHLGVVFQHDRSQNSEFISFAAQNLGPS